MPCTTARCILAPLSRNKKRWRITDFRPTWQKWVRREHDLRRQKGIYKLSKGLEKDDDEWEILERLVRDNDMDNYPLVYQKLYKTIDSHRSTRTFITLLSQAVTGVVIKLPTAQTVIVQALLLSSFWFFKRSDQGRTRVENELEMTSSWSQSLNLKKEAAITHEYDLEQR